MVVSRDEIETFIPKKQPKMVILGTMASINARTIDGKKQERPFYYHNNQNRFWKIMQMVFEQNPDPGFLSVDEKMNFLEKWQIAMANIVYEIKIASGNEKNASDLVIFEAHKRELVKVKRICDEFRTVLRSTPTFFTCLNKPPLTLLLNDYFDANGLHSSLIQKLCFLHSPTRVSTKTRGVQWREKMKDAFK